MFVQTRKCGGGLGGCVAKKLFRLLLVLFEIWTVGKGMDRAYETPFKLRLECPHESG